MNFSIPSLFISKPLYYSNGHNAQQIVDAPHSAVLLRWPNFPVIADHASDEGTWRLQYTIPNLTTCWVNDGVRKDYICIRKQRGNIADGKLYDAAGALVKNLKGIDLCIYTCTGRKKGKATEVWLTYWRKK
jgi:hypothetical protein